MTSIPKTMRGLVAPRWGPPSIYEYVDDLPVPTIERPDEVLVKVRACSMTAGETRFAKGMLRPVFKLEYIARPGRADAEELTDPA